MKQSYELLAPAGTSECLYAAFAAGADAVYLAGQSFGARAYAGNFSEEELLTALDYAHCHDKKIYLTLNTLIKEKEFSAVVPFLAPFYEAGLDGIIVQDLGLLPLLKRQFSGLPIHASTQMTVNSFRSAKWLKQWGVERVVPSRELSLQELLEIKEKAQIEVETFIHGALCYCYSGQCYFSSFLGGRSGNRGRCAGPCRLPYTGIPISSHPSQEYKKGKERYPLSLKDLCSLPFIYDLMDAQIDSFKIEGRMKSPEYVAGVTSIYRKYMDAYCENKGNRTFLPAIEKADLEQLQKLYIRSSMQDGYLKKHNGKDMVSLYSPSYTGSDEKFVKEIRGRYCNKKEQLPVSAKVILKIGYPAILQLKMEEISIEVQGDLVEEAKNRPLSSDEVRKQLQKTGQSDFYFENLSVSMDAAVFLTVKSLNELRRRALSALKEKMITGFRRKWLPVTSLESLNTVSKDIQDDLPKIQLQISVYQLEQWYKLVEMIRKADHNWRNNIQIRIYVPSDFFVLMPDFLEQIKEATDSEGIECFLALPRIFRKRSDSFLHRCMDIIPSFQGLLIRNLEELAFIQEQHYDGKLVGDYTLYQWNCSAISVLEKSFDEFCYPLELSEKEILDCKNLSGSYFIYGRVPMMVSANCVKKTLDHCSQKENGFSYTLVDRYHKNLPVYCNCIHCYNEIYNAVPTSLHKEIPQLLKKGFCKFRLDFSDEKAEEVQRICEYYFSIFMQSWNKTQHFPISETTTGHLKEGAY